MFGRNPTRKSQAPRLSNAQASRQGAVVRLACEAMGGSGAAMAFLNCHDVALGGRPIDIAIASPEGLAAVQVAIGLRAGS